MEKQLEFYVESDEVMGEMIWWSLRHATGRNEVQQIIYENFREKFEHKL